jgi:hypothetical protein
MSMGSVAKLALAALVAVMCVGPLAATSASAVETLFITSSGKALLFTGSGAVTLRGKEAGIEGTIKCELSKTHGFVLNKSSLARELHIEFEGKCEQTVGSTKSACTEPIKALSAYGELGLLHGHGLLLVAPEKGTELVEAKCAGDNTKFSGAVIGEFALNGADGLPQYGIAREDYLLLYKVKGTTQEPEEIELSGTLMKGVTLKAEGFLGEKASEETTQLLSFAGPTQIDGPQAALEPDPVEVDFAFVKETETKEIEIVFTAHQEVKIEKTIPPPPAPFGEGIADTCSDLTMKAGEQCAYVVKFTPTNKLLQLFAFNLRYEIRSIEKLVNIIIPLIGQGD